MKYEELKGLKDVKFKRLVGVKREVFEFQVAILEEALKEKHIHGGRLPKLIVEGILLLMYGYLRDYTTFLKLGMYFNLNESNAYRWTIWAENILSKYMTEDFDISNMYIMKFLLNFSIKAFFIFSPKLWYKFGCTSFYHILFRYN